MKCIHFFIFLSSLSLFGQQYSFKNFGVQQGLGQSQVYAIEEDSLGYLWLGTRGGGLSKFDGEKFQYSR